MQKLACSPKFLSIHSVLGICPATTCLCALVTLAAWVLTDARQLCGFNSHGIGEQISIRMPLRSRTWPTIWPQGFFSGDFTSTAPAANA